MTKDQYRNLTWRFGTMGFPHWDYGYLDHLERFVVVGQVSGSFNEDGSPEYRSFYRNIQGAPMTSIEWENVHEKFQKALNTVEKSIEKRERVHGTA